MGTVVEAPVTQLLDGLPLNGTEVSRHCTACGRELGVADCVRVYAYRMAESTEWDLPRLYCRGCKEEPVGTLGAVEVLANARLGSYAVSAWACVVAGRGGVVATSGATEGSAP